MASGPHAPYRRASPTCKSAFPAFGWGSLALIVGMICGDGPCRRWIRKTVLAIAEELTVDERLLRYWLDQPDDGFTARGSVHDLLVLLTFAPPGGAREVARARQLGEQLLSQASSLRLCIEEVNRTAGGHFGSFPQVFTHLALLLVIRGAEWAAPRPASRSGRVRALAAVVLTCW